MFAVAIQIFSDFFLNCIENMASSGSDELPPSYFEAVKMPGAVGSEMPPGTGSAPPYFAPPANFTPYQWNTMNELGAGVYFVDFCPTQVNKSDLPANESFTYVSS